MGKAGIAAVLALVAALFIAISDAVQQRLAYGATDERVGAIALFTRLLRSPRWWLGSLVAAVGFALQAAALGLGSVVLVQALFVTSLPFALPISAKLGHRKVTGSEWTWAALLAASVAVIVTVGNPQSGHSRAPLGTWMVVVAVIGPALVLCLLGARIWSGPIRAVLLGLVSGYQSSKVRTCALKSGVQVRTFRYFWGFSALRRLWGADHGGFGVQRGFEVRSQ